MSETSEINGTQDDEWNAFFSINKVNSVKFENTNVLPNQSSTVENDDVTDDEWVVKELKKERENLFTEQQMKEAMLLILEYIVGQMEKREKIDIFEKSKEIIESFKKPK